MAALSTSEDRHWLASTELRAELAAAEYSWSVHEGWLDELTAIALSLRERVDATDLRFRLVGVGLGNFQDRDELVPPQDLFS